MQNNLKAKKCLGMWILLSIVQRLACDLIIYSLIKAFAGRWGAHRIHTEWQRLSGDWRTFHHDGKISPGW